MALLVADWSVFHKKIALSLLSWQCDLFLVGNMEWLSKAVLSDVCLCELQLNVTCKIIFFWGGGGHVLLAIGKVRA